MKETTVSCKAIQYRDFYLSNLNEVNIEDYLNKTHFTNLMPFPFNEINKNANEKIEYSLSRITAKLTNYLLVSTSKHFMVKKLHLFFLNLINVFLSSLAVLKP